MGSPSLHIAMFPWFGFGHISTYLHISNKLAKKGHKVSFFIPTKTQSKVQDSNLFPDLITFIPITVPHVDGLPPGAETTADVPKHLIPLVLTAFDRTELDLGVLLSDLKPDIVFFDAAHWMPKLARRLGIKSVSYFTVNAVLLCYTTFTGMKFGKEKFTVADATLPPPGFPDPSIRFRLQEARQFLEFISRLPTDESNTGFFIRPYISMKESDAVAIKTSREIEGPFVDHLQRMITKPVLLAGPVFPDQQLSSLDERWANWLSGFKPRSVVYCALGSETNFKSIDQFQQLLLGLELSGLPFFAVLKPPFGAETIEEALPDGFRERVGGRGVVHDGWIQQQLVLEHESVGCFITHCGWGSLCEGLLNSTCELVLLPQECEQILNARLMGNNLKVGIEVAKGEEDGLFTKESVCDAIKKVMEVNCSEIGKEIRANRAKLREQILNKSEDYIDEFSTKLMSL